EQRSFRLSPIFAVESSSLKLHRHQSPQAGFQDQEDGTILETEERSVRYWYVSTGGFGSVPYSPSIKLQRNTSSSKSALGELFYAVSDRAHIKLRHQPRFLCILLANLLLELLDGILMNKRYSTASKASSCHTRA